MEILHEGDEAGEGLVRTCIFAVPKWLLSGGKGRSFETVTEAKLNKLSRYVAVGAPLWSRAEGYHELEEQPDGTTVLTFHETYYAYNPVLRFLLERPSSCGDLARQPGDLRARARFRRQGHPPDLGRHTARRSVGGALPRWPMATIHKEIEIHASPERYGRR